MIVLDELDPTVPVMKASIDVRRSNLRETICPNNLRSSHDYLHGYRRKPEEADSNNRSYPVR